MGLGLFHLPANVRPIKPDGGLSVPHTQLLTNLFNLLNQGYPPAKNNLNGQAMPQQVVIATAKLTPGGANGSMTFTNGILTASTPAT
jgi:hypothetical protein